jgi:hypothetical protein
MSKVPWHLFQDRQPRVHLVVGAVLQPNRPVGSNELTAARSVLIRLVRAQKPASYYATTVVREGGRPEVHLAFADKNDARKLADVVEAKPTSNYRGVADRIDIPVRGRDSHSIGCLTSGPKDLSKATAVG